MNDQIKALKERIQTLESVIVYLMCPIDHGHFPKHAGNSADWILETALTQEVARGVNYSIHEYGSAEQVIPGTHAICQDNCDCNKYTSDPTAAARAFGVRYGQAGYSTPLHLSQLSGSPSLPTHFPVGTSTTSPNKNLNDTNGSYYIPTPPMLKLRCRRFCRATIRLFGLR